MRKQSAIHLAGIVIAGCVFSGSATAAPPAGCPTENEVRASVERYILEDWWSPSQRETWQIADVGDFSFGPIKYGSPRYSECPVRMEYSFRVWHNDGRIEETRKGVGETFSFFKNNFDEWRFTVGPS
ncbi:MAG: hypothetical protein F9K19_08040 [Rhizobiaceae bacterium]|nr:MAG: hypothetical protein F9K19_08040 [Rhizobiaceae bacterium]CAG1012985.1 hypothetical protein RHIZO_04390 [Rhizobiaceae bacterium]